MILHFVKIMGLSKKIHEQNTTNPFRREDLLGQFLKYDTKNVGVINPKNVEILEFQKVEMCQDNEFLR